MLIFGIIVAVTVDAYFSFLNRQRLSEAVEGTVSMIQKARSLTLMSQDSTGTGKRYGVHFDDKNALAPNVPNRVVLFAGDSYISTAVLETYQFPASINIDALFILVSGVPYTEIYFDRIVGTASVKQGTSFVEYGCPLAICIVVKSTKSGETKIINIFPTTGVVNVY